MTYWGDCGNAKIAVPLHPIIDINCEYRLRLSKISYYIINK